MILDIFTLVNVGKIFVIQTKGAIAKKRCPEQKWTGKVEKVRNESGPQRQTMKSAQRPTNAKPVDEDLYKIPPHLLPGYKRVSFSPFFFSLKKYLPFA